MPIRKIRLDQIGLFYYNGWGVQKNESEALKWFERAANHGNVYGMYNSGFFYREGRGTELDYVKAKEYFEKAAAADHLQSMVELATAYKDGFGCQKNYQEAFRLFTLASDKGDAYSENQIGSDWIILL